MRVRVTEEKWAKGREICFRRWSLCPRPETSTSEALRSASYLNFVQSAGSSSFCHLRGGWDIVTKSGATESCRRAFCFADCRVRLSGS